MPPTHSNERLLAALSRCAQPVRSGGGHGGHEWIRSCWAERSGRWSGQAECPPWGVGAAVV